MNHSALYSPAADRNKAPILEQLRRATRFQYSGWIAALPQRGFHPTFAICE
jgi:hypothetical protein